MKIKYVKKAGIYKYPEIIEAIKEVFETIAKSKWNKYFKTVKVVFYPGVIFNSRSPAYMAMGLEGPSFHFGISALHGLITLQPQFIRQINNGNYNNLIHSVQLIAAHEIGHWILLSSLAKREKYGGHPFVVQELISDEYTKVNLEGYINRRSDDQIQKSYRGIFQERSADRIARFIVNKKMKGGSLVVKR